MTTVVVKSCVCFLWIPIPTRAARAARAGHRQSDGTIGKQGVKFWQLSRCAVVILFAAGVSSLRNKLKGGSDVRSLLRDPDK